MKLPSLIAPVGSRQPSPGNHRLAAVAASSSPITVPRAATSSRSASPASAAGASKPPVTGGLLRETFTAGGKELPDGQLGKLVRKEGQAAIGDGAVDAAHDNAGIVHAFFKQVLGRDSIDGKGMTLKSTAHYGEKFNNAYWDGLKMTYGDGDGQSFSPLSQSLDVVAHEMAHGVTERTAGLNYEHQPGALNESWSDVFGELVEQWHNDPKAFSQPQGATAADWMIGEDVFTPGTAGDALRSLKAPGTAYQGDPQPAHMRDYRKMQDDNGGVHVNSGIPNRAAYEAATRLGGEKVARIWFKTLTDYLRPDSQFTDAANYTVSAARDLFGDKAPEVQALRDAWKGVGLNPRLVPRPTGARPAHVTPAGNPGTVPAWLSGAHGLAPTAR